MTGDCDLAIVGAGPAGLAAAALAAELGLAVTLLDEQDAPGGQIYRALEATASQRPAAFRSLGLDYAAGERLIAGLRRADIRYLPRAFVWNLAPKLELAYSQDGRSRQVRPRHVLVATGAIERPTPLPGWTLPGVMTAGGLQVLLKTAGLVPSGRLILAGSGPLLLLVARQLVAAGAPPAAIVETVPFASYLGALPRLPAALTASSQLAKGLRMLWHLRRSAVPFYRGARLLAVEGGRRVEALRFRAAGREIRLKTELLALHQGVIPNLQLTRLLGCAHVWDPLQRAFRPRLDAWYRSSHEGLSVAGDGGGIGGAAAAVCSGRLAVLGAAERLGVLTAPERDRRAAGERRLLRGELAVKPFLDRLYAPPGDLAVPTDDTIVCRCEEVTAGQLREALGLGCLGPNQVKTFLRCGMGPCQGRFCGPTVTAMIAAVRSVDPAAVGAFRVRPPLKPLALGELATFEATRSGAGGEEGPLE